MSLSIPISDTVTDDPLQAVVVVKRGRGRPPGPQQPRVRPKGPTAAKQLPKSMWNLPKETKDLERVLRRLPDKATVAVELDWIRAHPAMMRLAQQGGGEQEIKLGKDDVTPPHGICPSRAAFHELQSWVNRPNKFFDALMAERKKQKEQAEATRVEPDMGIAEVEALLRAVSV